MSDKKMQEPSDQSLANDQICNTPQPIRRKLLKGTVAVPIIMTLHSGAALARTSNLVGAVESGEAAKIGDEFVCVLPPIEEGNPDLETGKYDLGDEPTAILVSEAEECTGGENRGILISANALASLQGRGFLADF